MVSGVAQLLNKAACWLLISALDCFCKTHIVTLNEPGSGSHRDTTDTMTMDVFHAEHIQTSQHAADIRQSLLCTLLHIITLYGDSKCSPVQEILASLLFAHIQCLGLMPSAQACITTVP